MDAFRAFCAQYRVDPESGKNSNDPNDPHQADPARYEAQLRSIVTRLKKTGASLVFATTTPVPDGVRPFRAPADAVEYNRVARAVMNEHHVPINNLFAFVVPRLAELQNVRDVHFSKEGSAALGKEVAEVILRVADGSHVMAHITRHHLAVLHGQASLVEDRSSVATQLPIGSTAVGRVLAVGVPQDL